MNQRDILLVCTVVIAASSLATSLDDKYLKWTYEEPKYSDDLQFEILLDAFQDLSIEIKFGDAHKRLISWLDSTAPLQPKDTKEARQEIPADAPGTSEAPQRKPDYVYDTPEKVLSKIKEAFSDYRVDKDKKLAYKDLMNLADEYGNCKGSMKSTVLRFFYLLRDKKNGLGPLVPFFESYGAIKFGRCIKDDDIMGELKEDPNNSYEKALDQFFPASVGLKGVKPTDGLVLERLRSLDWSSDNVNVVKAPTVAKNLLGRLGKRSKISFNNVLSCSCSHLEKYHTDAMDIVALAYAFIESYDLFPIEVQKALEYRRLCLAWKREQWKGDGRRKIRRRLAELDV